MSPNDIPELANELSAGNREVDWRCAASRAYYAAFHSARLFLERLGFAVPWADQAHAYLWLRLANCGQLDLSVAGKRLNDLRYKRNWADYDLDRLFAHTTAFDQVQVAMDIMRTLEAVSNTSTVLSAIIVTIKSYERDVLRQVTWKA